MRTSSLLAAGALLAFAISGQLRIFDLLTISLILASWAIAAAWLRTAPDRRARWRARLVALLAHSARTIGTLDPDPDHDGRVRVGIDELLVGPRPRTTAGAGGSTDGGQCRASVPTITWPAGGDQG
ncbi:MAG TPA: hypothetical protein VLX31_18950 [Streptosporangiaceae bacterium]|nr:hypothetical protein [Streptosporangiaceae bacterium]